MKATKREDGRYVVKITLHSGRQRYVYAATSAAAKREANRILALDDSGELVDKTRMTVREWSEVWQKEYLVDISAGTLKSYKSAIKNHILPAIGDMQIQKVTKPRLQKFANNIELKRKPRKDPKSQLEQQKELAGMQPSPKSVKNIVGVLHAMFKDAVEADLIPKNPAENLKIPKLNKPDLHPLSETEVPIFLQIASEDKFYSLFYLDLMSGLRLGEIVGLTWDRVDLNAGLITVDRQILEGPRPYAFGVPKHGKTRIVQIPGKAVAELRKVRTKQLTDKLRIGSAWSNDEGFVFTYESGLGVSRRAVQKHMHRIAEAIGRPEVRFHDLRHTYAVLSIQSGIDMGTLSANLGHEKSSFTIDVYAFVTQKMRESAADKLDVLAETIGF